ncbi:hypothetical protein [Bacillus thuringiensis]|uniref:Uncharacterized protein n=1 Tax=Bacillus thuringiensis subsp. konkukian (strain 97-27) TaxID=281309 RepID=Q6HIA2_BACHK|nr:hypothetical protein [Bacillus thuringiensis]AAT59999.1 hypothetical protein BT9727_2398 [[Bacillus thuringiensis] serovar konkukian str. 97-27]
MRNFKTINLYVMINELINGIFIKNGKVDIKAHNRLQPNTYSVSVVKSKYNMIAMRRIISRLTCFHYELYL